MNRRGFLGSILALGAAPAIVRADSLMRIVPTETIVLSWAQEVAAAYAGLNGRVREMWANDIVTDSLIYRLDVLGMAPDGSLVQEGVNFRPTDNYSIDDGRKVALEVLERHVRSSGLKLVQPPPIPKWMQGRHL